MRSNLERASWRWWSGFVLAGAVLVLGCDRSGDAGGWLISADTVDGIIHVTNTPPLGRIHPTLVAREDLRIASSRGGAEATFGMIRSIAVLQDGRIAVADGQAEEIRIFDAEGQHLRTLGGKGGGPGELDGMQGALVDHAGMLRVAEQGNARVSVFDPDLGFDRSYPLRLWSSSPYGPWKAVFDSVGRTLVASSGPYGAGRTWMMLRIYDAEMRQIDSIPYHDYTDDSRRESLGTWRIPVGNGTFHAFVPFFSNVQETLTSSGEFWTSPEGTQELRVTRWHPRGDTTLILESGRQPDRVTAAERDSAMQALRGRVAELVGSTPKLDASKIPSTRPPVYGLSLDDRGRLWTRVSDPAVDSTVYDVFDSNGEFAETVLVPLRVDPWIPPTVIGDTIWVVAVDELEVQSVVRASLQRTDKH